MSAGFWTADKIAQLRELAAEGKSFAVIANLLGCSRNAAIAKAARLDIDNGHMPFPRAISQRPRQKPASKPIAPKPLPEPVEERSDCVVPLLAADHSHCRWPMWTETGGEYPVCGQTAVDGQPYCAAHGRRSRNAIRSAAA